MRFTNLLGSLALVFLLFLSGCAEVNNSPSSSVVNTYVISSINMGCAISTDKGLYHSNEPINVSVVLDAEKVLNNVTINVFGIHASKFRLNESRLINLTEGKNVLFFSFMTPSCNRCSGINPGMYDVFVGVLYNNELVTNSSVRIDVQQ